MSEIAERLRKVEQDVQDLKEMLAPKSAKTSETASSASEILLDQAQETENGPGPDASDEVQPEQEENASAE